MPRALAYGRLLRLSLAPSALADVAAGTVLGASAWPAGARPFVLMLASACVYHGGMALNDWADRTEDARLRGERPIPSGAIAPGTALALAACLLALGPLLAFLVAPRCALVLGAVSACAALYDLAGRGAWTGPLLLAICRAGNLGVGLAFASTFVPWRPLLLFAPLAYATYVFLVSRLARLEDVDPARVASRELHPARWTLAAAAALLGVGVVAELLAQRVSLATASFPWKYLGSVVLAALAAYGLFARVRELSGAPWAAREIQRTAGMALRRLLVASAAFAYGAASLAGCTVALVILLGYPLSFALRKVFPPT